MGSLTLLSSSQNRRGLAKRQSVFGWWSKLQFSASLPSVPLTYKSTDPPFSHPSQLWTQGVPIEVIPCTASYVQQVLTKSLSVSFPILSSPTHYADMSSLFSSPTTSISLRLGGTAKAGPLVTDNSNFILDVVFTSGM